MEDGDIVLLISDDGVGIAPDKLPVILSGEGTSISGGTNIAIYNTHRRLQVLYGADYGLTYSSDVGKGTEVDVYKRQFFCFMYNGNYFNEGRFTCTVFAHQCVNCARL